VRRCCGAMIPAPNLIAGFLIGMFVSPWSRVAAASALWGLVWCLYVWISKQHMPRIAAMQDQTRQLIFGSAILAFWLVEWTLGFITALACGTVAYYLPVLGWAAK
jgi:hypothetical protein